MNRYSHLFIPVFVIAALLLIGCDKNRVFEQNKEVEGGLWNSGVKLSFETTITDTVTPHNVFINVRNASDYPYSNLYLFVNTHYPNGTVSRDTVNCILQNEKGEWMGEGLGDLWDNRILFKPKVIFKQAGKYIFELEQAMRIDKLPMITDAGIRIEKEQ